MTPRFFCNVAFVLSLLFATGHTLGFLQSRHAARHNPAMADLTRAMRDYKARVLGFEPSILDFREYFSICFSVLLVLATAATWMALRHAADPISASRALGLLNALGFGVLTALSAIYSVPQGMISAGLIALAYTAAAATAFATR